VAQTPEITQDQFLEWKQHPVTALLFQDIQERKVDIEAYLSSADYLSEPNALVLLAIAKGKLEIYTNILDTRWEDEVIE